MVSERTIDSDPVLHTDPASPSWRLDTEGGLRGWLSMRVGRSDTLSAGSQPSLF
jgi:hypothetical protein